MSRRALQLCIHPLGRQAEAVESYASWNDNDHSSERYNSHSVPSKHFRELVREELDSCDGPARAAIMDCPGAQQASFSGSTGADEDSSVT